MAIIGSVIGIGATLLSRSDSNDAREESKQVDYSTMSPEAKAVLQGLFGAGSSLAKGVLDKDFGAIRQEMVDTGVKSAITGVLNQDIPGLKAAMGKAGAFNSTSFGIAANDALSSAVAKSFYAANAAADSRIQSELSLINPILQLLQLDKGSVKKGIDIAGGSGGGGGVNYASLGKDAGNVVGGIMGLFTGP